MPNSWNNVLQLLLCSVIPQQLLDKVPTLPTDKDKEYFSGKLPNLLCFLLLLCHDTLLISLGYQHRRVWDEMKQQFNRVYLLFCNTFFFFFFAQEKKKIYLPAYYILFEEKHNLPTFQIYKQWVVFWVIAQIILMAQFLIR